MPNAKITTEEIYRMTRKPTAKGSIRFRNKAKAAKSDKVGRKCKHKKGSKNDL